MVRCRRVVVRVLLGVLVVLGGALGPAGTATAAPAPAISGGEVADATTSAFVVRIDVARSATSTHVCTGSLVAPRLVLTAAHCLYSTRVADWTVTFAHGTRAAEERGVVRVLPLTARSGERTDRTLDDLAVVQLDRPVTRAPVALDRAAGTVARGTGEGVVEYGYGATRGGEQVGDGPVRRGGQVLDGPVSFRGAPDGTAPLLRTSLYAARPGLVAPGTCEDGDSGGPLLSRADGTGVLLGVVSEGNSGSGNCWYTRVDAAAPLRARLDALVADLGGTAPARTAPGTTTGARPGVTATPGAAPGTAVPGAVTLGAAPPASPGATSVPGTTPGTASAPVPAPAAGPDPAVVAREQAAARWRAARASVDLGPLRDTVAAGVAADALAGPPPTPSPPADAPPAPPPPGTPAAAPVPILTDALVPGLVR